MNLKVMCLLGVSILMASCAVIFCRLPHSAQTTESTVEHDSVQLMVESATYPSAPPIFSPDEKFLAMTDSRSISIFDLLHKKMTRRIDLELTPAFTLYTATPISGKASLIPRGVTENFKFSDEGDTIFAQSGSAVLACPAGASGDCTVVTDSCRQPVLQGKFISCINLQNEPILIDLGNPKVSIILHDNIPQSERSSFGWRIAQFSEDKQGPSKLLLAGVPQVSQAGIPLDSPRPDAWKVFVFDLRDPQTPAIYTHLPLKPSYVAFGNDGRPYVAGGCDLGSTSNTLLVYDLSNGRYIPKLPQFEERQEGCRLLHESGSAQSTISKSYYQNLSNRFKDFHIPNNLWFGATVSPSGSSAVYFDLNGFLYFVSKNDYEHPVLLGGPIVPTTRLEFVRHPKSSERPSPLNDFVLQSGSPGLNSFWNFHGGEVKWGLGDLSITPNPSAPLIGLLTPESQGSSDYKVLIQNIRTGDTLPFHATLHERPNWFGISSDGATLVAELKSGMTAFRAGVVTTLPCSSPGLYSIDRRGDHLAGLCGRHASNPESDGTDVFLIVWGLKTLSESKRIRVPGICSGIAQVGNGCYIFNLAGSMQEGWSKDKVVITTGSDVIVIDLTTGQRSGFSTSTMLASATLTSSGHTVVDFTKGYLEPPDKMEWRDLNSGKVLRSVNLSSSVAAFDLDELDDVAVATTDNVISVYSAEGRRLVRLVRSLPPKPGQPYGWAALSESGYFDSLGSTRSFIRYTVQSESSVRNMDTLFNELYYPGILQRIGSAEYPKLPPGIALSTYLDVPGLKQLLARWELRPQWMSNGEAALCIERTALYDALQQSLPLLSKSKLEEDNNPSCPRRLILADQLRPATEVDALKGLKTLRERTPWDGQRMSPSGGTIHVLTVAIGAYTSPTFPKVPTALTSARKVEDIFRNSSPEEHVRLWNADGCSQGLFDSAATKANIVDCIQKIATVAKPEDMVVLFFIGHGGTTGDTELFNFYPADYSESSGPGGDSSALSSADLADIIRFLSARRVVLILDACDSGVGMEPLASAIQAKIREAAVTTTISPSTPTDSEAMGALLIAASTGLENTSGSEEVNPFVEKLLRLLSRGAENGDFIWSYDISRLIEEQASSETSYHAIAIPVGANFAITKGKQ